MRRTRAEVLARIHELAAQHGVQIRAAVNWSFEFEDQPYFAGFRDMATNGIDKPVLNIFRMMGLLGGQQIEAQSSGALSTIDVLKSGVRGPADVSVVATRKEHETDVLVWNYHDDDLAAPAGADRAQDQRSSIRRSACSSNTSASMRRTAMRLKRGRQWVRRSSRHEKQYRELEAAGQLQLLSSPEWVTEQNQRDLVALRLAEASVSLVRVTW